LIEKAEFDFIYGSPEQFVIITRGVTVKIQHVTVRGNYENPTNDAKGEDE
jgi:hypothetical protein